MYNRASRIVSALAIVATTAMAALAGNLFPARAIGGTTATLDSSYGTNGSVSVSFTGATVAIATQGLMQSDGKVIIVGNVDSGTGGANVDWDIALTRLNTDGSLDTSFGTGGKVVTKPHTGAQKDDYVYTATLQSDGKILAAGAYTVTGTNTDLFLVRYNADGTLDNTFGTSGWLVSALSSKIDRVYGIAVQSDGKIVTTGITDSGGASANYDFFVARFSATGTLDNTFGTSGRTITDTGINADQSNALVIQPDGKIVSGGTGSGGNNNFTVMRYNTNGTLDSTFGFAGIMTQTLRFSSEVSDLAIQSDGKIIAAGGVRDVSSSINTEMLITRLNADGTLDNSFGTGGNVIQGSATSSWDRAESVRVLSNGKIAAAGYTNNFSDNPWNYDVELLRLNADGSADTTFGTGGGTGFLVLDPGTGTANNSEAGYSLLQQADGKFVVVGYNGPTYMLTSSFFALREQNLTTLPTTTTTTTTTTTVAPPTTVPSSSGVQNVTTTTAAKNTTSSNTDVVGKLSVKPITKSSAKPGEQVTVSADGFTANETVNVLIGSSSTRIGSTKASATGKASVKVRIPSSLSGTQRIAMYAPVSGKGYQQTISVNSNLPTTGTNSDSMSLYAIALILCGVGFIYRRKLTA